MEEHEYVSVNNAEVIPEVCNEFVTVFMEARRNSPHSMNRQENVEMTRHMCHWMFINGHTCSKLSVI